MTWTYQVLAFDIYCAAQVSADRRERNKSIVAKSGNDDRVLHSLRLDREHSASLEQLRVL